MLKNGLKYYLWILGCQMNEADGERIASVLEKLGYQKTSKETEADLIMVVACSVRQSAIDRIYGKANKWNQLKQIKPLTTVLSGCVLEHDKQNLAKIFDLFFDINDLAELPKLLTADKILPTTDYFKIHPIYLNNFQAYVPISTGCNNFCSYCVVPYTRGREKSRPSIEIIDECQTLINQGYKEITLLGQNVNSYQDPTINSLTQNFVLLLQKINNLKGDFWLRFMTSHPKDMSDELIDLIAKNDKICDYIHLPFQAGDNKILQKMNRKYTQEHYLNLIDKIKTKIPNVALSTDIIVGFPGETKKQFKQTVKIMKQVKYDMAYLSEYSPRFGTASYNFTDDVPKKEKMERKMILDKILKKTALKNSKNYLGQTVEILVEKRKGEYLIGKTKTFKDVRFKSKNDIIGQFVTIKITKVTNFSLEGELL